MSESVRESELLPVEGPSDSFPSTKATRSFPGGLSPVAIKFKELNEKYSGLVLQSVEPAKRTVNPDAILTYAQLEEHDACDNKLAFRELWGDSVEVTPELAKRYVDEFDWGWAASHLLPTNVYRLWEKGQKVVREKHRAMVSEEDYRYRYLPNGSKRMRFTDLQKERHVDRMEKINNWFREQQAVSFAKMYVSRHRMVKSSKTEKMLEEFASKVDALVQDIVNVNHKEQFKENWEIEDILGGRLRDIARRIG